MRSNKYCIAIKTSAGTSLGMGHMQRMCSLLWYLNECKSIKTLIVSDRMPDSFPIELQKYYINNLNFLPDLIIRDMRDSAKDEITHLKKIAPVIVIDDNGPGRITADHAIDILPNPDAGNQKINSGNFIYGYNFLAALRKLKDKNIKKELDYAVYPGNSASTDYVDFLSSLLPENSDYAVLNGKDSYVIKRGKKDHIKESSYAKTILSSKAIISHFGITLYEGLIANCGLISINPTSYHSKLSDMAKAYLNLTNLGEYTNLNIEVAKSLIKKTAQNPLCIEVNAADVYMKVIDGLENFSQAILGPLNPPEGGL